MFPTGDSLVPEGLRGAAERVRGDQLGDAARRGRKRVRHVAGTPADRDETQQSHR